MEDNNWQLFASLDALYGFLDSRYRCMAGFVSYIWMVVSKQRKSKYHQKVMELCIMNINSLIHGKCSCNLKLVLFQLTRMIDILRISYKTALKWMPKDLSNNWSILVQVMACCLTARSHYPSRCWTRSMTPYGVTRPQWVKASHFTDHCTISQKLIIRDNSRQAIKAPHYRPFVLVIHK